MPAQEDAAAVRERDFRPAPICILKSVKTESLRILFNTLFDHNMPQEAFFFSLVAYAIIVISLLVLVGIIILYFRDGIQQEPRFGKVLKALAILCLLGLLFLGANVILPWAPFYILGMTFAGTPAVIVLFVAGSFLWEATKFDGGIAVAVLGSFGGVLLGLLLLVLRYYLERA